LTTGDFPDILTYQNESGITFTEKYLLWPIPTNQIDINPNLLPQKPGW